MKTYAKKPCASCGAVFRPTNGRSRYCSAHQVRQDRRASMSLSAAEIDALEQVLATLARNANTAIMARHPAILSVQRKLGVASARIERVRS